MIPQRALGESRTRGPEGTWTRNLRVWSIEYGERLPRRVEGVELPARTYEDDRAGYPCLSQVMAVSGW